MKNNIRSSIYTVHLTEICLSTSFIHKKAGASFLETSTVTQRHGVIKKQTEEERK